MAEEYKYYTEITIGEIDKELDEKPFTFILRSKEFPSTDMSILTRSLELAKLAFEMEEQ